MSRAPIGILGGTFDPIHFGHLRLAQEAYEQCRLAEVRFIPSGTPPHRAPPHASAAQRLEMARLALADNPAFVLDARESRRNDACYTVDTLQALRAEFGPDVPLCLLLGGDAFLLLHTWNRWRQLFELAHLVVKQRPGSSIDQRIEQADEALRLEYHARRQPIEALHRAPAGVVTLLDLPQLEISASDIRQRCASGASIRYLTPDRVTQYIESNHLYRGASC